MTTEKLDYITIRGFRSIASIEQLELRSLNVLIGANGSGKSNFLEVFAFLREIREGRLQDYVVRQGGADQILHFGAKTSPRLELHLSFGNGRNAYHITLGAVLNDRLVPIDERISYSAPQVFSEPREHSIPAQGSTEAGISDERTTLRLDGVEWRLGTWTKYHFHDTGTHAALRKTSQVHDNRFLRPDGSNLAAFLYLLREQHFSAYRTVLFTIQQVAPFFGDFVLEPLALTPDLIRLGWRHRGSDAYFDVSSLSDGTLRFIALATLLLQPEALRPPIILIDEPELGLHPAAIILLGSMLRMASTRAQVILSTQSSLLLDQFEPEDVIVAEHEGLATTLRRLDPERLKDWLEDFSLGELWEKYELGGQP